MYSYLYSQHFVLSRSVLTLFYIGVWWIIRSVDTQVARRTNWARTRTVWAVSGTSRAALATYPRVTTRRQPPTTLCGSPTAATGPEGRRRRLTKRPLRPLEWKRRWLLGIPLVSFVLCQLFSIMFIWLITVVGTKKLFTVSTLHKNNRVWVRTKLIQFCKVVEFYSL